MQLYAKIDLNWLFLSFLIKKHKTMCVRHNQIINIKFICIPDIHTHKGALNQCLACYEDSQTNDRSLMIFAGERFGHYVILMTAIDVMK